MWFVPIGIFGISCVGIISLFILKRAELARGHRYLEHVRVRADEGALRVKDGIEMCEWYLERLPWFVGALVRYSIHVGALAFARLARTSAERAHHLADFVSHKRNFERRVTTSEFLKKVTEHKNSSGDDTVATL